MSNKQRSRCQGETCFGIVPPPHLFPRFWAHVWTVTSIVIKIFQPLQLKGKDWTDVLAITAVPPHQANRNPITLPLSPPLSPALPSPAQSGFIAARPEAGSLMQFTSFGNVRALVQSPSSLSNKHPNNLTNAIRLRTGKRSTPYSGLHCVGSLCPLH
jgi:hypothetical protein